jgi:hypothetical protein
MKDQIDALVHSILDDLAQQDPVPEIRVGLQLVGMDRHSRAAAKRATIERWSMDETLPADDRKYAQQRLDALPDF